MAKFTDLGVRLALAYLLIISGVDTISHIIAATGTTASDHALLATALFGLIGGLLLAIGWQVSKTALTLAAIVLLSAILNASLIAALISIGLLLLWSRAARQCAQKTNADQPDDGEVRTATTSRCRSSQPCCA